MCSIIILCNKFKNIAWITFPNVCNALTLSSLGPPFQMSLGQDYFLLPTGSTKSHPHSRILFLGMCSHTLNFLTGSVLVRLVLTVCFLPSPFLFFFLVCRRLYLLILIFTSIKEMFSLLFFIHWKTPASLTPALFLSGFPLHFLHAYSPSSQGPCEQWRESMCTKQLAPRWSPGERCVTLTSCSWI